MAESFVNMVKSGAWTILSPLHGETVSYTAYGGAATNYTAIIDRAPLRETPGLPGMLDYEAEVWISQTNLTAINVQGDKVAFKKQPADSANTTHRVIGKEAVCGLWRLAVKAT